MTHPPPHRNSLSSIATGINGPSAATSVSSQQPSTAFSQSTSSNRQRVLSPISTAAASTSTIASPHGSRHGSQSQREQSPSSPFTPSFSSVLNSSSRSQSSRLNPSQSSLQNPPQAGFQQPDPLFPSRTKTNPLPTYSQAFAAGASSSVGQGGGGGGGGGSSGGGGFRTSGGFSPSTVLHTNLVSPTSSTFNPNTATTPTSATTTNQPGQFSKITITQVLILLSTMKPEKDNEKWEAQADQIRKLVEDSNDMDVYAKYLRKLISGNAPTIFPSTSRPVENAANYPLLQMEMRKLATEDDQAQKIAESLDGGDGDLFRDFDLSTFMEHFKLDALEKIILALALKEQSKPDLKTKADAIISTNYTKCLDIISNPSHEAQKHTDLPPQILSTFVDRLLQYSPPNFKDEAKASLLSAVRRRFPAPNFQVPPEIIMSLKLIDILNAANTLARHIQSIGPQCTDTIDACKEMLKPVEATTKDPEQVATALLFLVINRHWRRYSPHVFVRYIQSRNTDNSMRWQEVVQAFDQENVQLDPDRFLALYKALEPLAVDDPGFDIQSLWSGKWDNQDTQRSFVTSLMTLQSDRLDATTIPQVQYAIDERDLEDASEPVKAYLPMLKKSPISSLEAIAAFFEVAIRTHQAISTAEGQKILSTVIQPNMDVFLCAAFGLDEPKTESQQEILVRLFFQFLLRQVPHHDFVLHLLWKRDKHWVAQRLFQLHSENPMHLSLLLDHAEEQHWTEDLLTVLNGFGLDLAALAHKRGLLDLDKWAEANSERAPEDLVFALSRFLTIKAEDEMRVVRGEQPSARTVSLAIKTVNGFLELLEEFSDPQREEIITVQRLCIQAYPRLINYGEDYDQVIESNGKESNALPEAADLRMQEYYKKMYSAEVEVRDIVQALQKFKHSQDAAEQDLFACMIHGLFDEYSCFHEYPLEALATTAVLFGGLVNFGLISGIPLRVALGMILEAVRDYDPETRMYKFGLQALTNFKDRLHEWVGFCSLLILVPGLQGTEPYEIAERTVREKSSQAAPDGDMNSLENVNGLSTAATLTNGNIDDIFPAEQAMQRFTCLHVDPPLQAGIYENPTEDVQDKVLFVLNNISDRNFSTKIQELEETLEERHHQWFANYLVEERAKMQPNFHRLYLNMLDSIDDKMLRSEVLRETYVSVIRMLNSQSIVQSVPERGHLKNLGSWLGSLTLASDKPIKQKNIAFKELLIEAYDSKRLLAVIPFVCKVLDQASKSLVFKPPNPWLMEIIRLLVELYHFGELKLNGKFEVEVLCKDLGLDHNTIEPSTALRDRPNPEDELAMHAPQDDLDCFEDSFMANRQGIRSERFSSEAITSSLPELGPLLVYPPSTHTMVSQTRLRQIVQTAVQRAIYEIISPVVERSVTIAAISTQQLIHKDFATEPNEERVRQSALTMVKALAGSLALVTCKEPLRMSMTNYIRMMSAELGDQALPEGAILMCVNDNLDAACGLVENAAEQRSMPEIEENIEQQLRARRQHRAARPNEPFVDPIYNRWSTYIPEPYKPSASGLNKEQMGIYEEFARQSRGPSSHTNGPSLDSGRSMGNEAMADQFPPVPNLPTPAEPPAVPRQAVPQQQQRIQGSQLSSQSSHPQMNGYADPKAVSERLQALLGDLQNVSREAPEQHVRELGLHSSTLKVLDQILRLIFDSPNREDLCISAARWASSVLYTQTEKTLEVEALVQLLHKLCHLSALTAKEVILWLAGQKEEAYYNVPVTVALLDTGLIEIHRVDVIIAKALSQHKAPAVDLLHNILDEVLLNDNPIALRADFVNSLQAIGQWLHETPDLPAEDSLVQLVQKLKDAGVPEITATPPDELSLVRRDQVEYIFVEWVRLCSFPGTNEHAYYAFISQMHRKKLMSSDADSCLFFRLCIDISVEAFEREEMNPSGKVSDAYIQTDALARMIALLTKFHGESDGAVKVTKTEYLYSILSLVVLVLCHHHNERGDRFNQKVFFRLFSSILCEQKLINRESAEGEKDSMMVFAKIFLTLQPDYFPGFAFGWLTLISHRIFMPGMLLLADHDAWDAYAKLVKALLTYVGEQLKPVNIPSIAKDLYRGVLRVLLVLHHDFPEFLAENHVMLCSVVPAHCTQLRNLILSAYPSSFPELPDPFTAGLKVDRIVEIRNTPQISIDIEGPLRKANIKDLVDACISGDPTEEIIISIARAVDDSPEHETGVAYSTVHVDTAILNSLVLYIGTSAIAAVEQKGGPTFVSTSRQAHLMAKLVRELRPEARYYFLSAIANQLRYPNSHTHYFSYTLLYLFGSDLNDQQESDVKQQITRVLLERLIVHRPHPWGLIITLLELLKNPEYMFWDLPFIKAAPEIERLFAALVQHVNSGR